MSKFIQPKGSLSPVPKNGGVVNKSTVEEKKAVLMEVVKSWGTPPPKSVVSKKELVAEAAEIMVERYGYKLDGAVKTLSDLLGHGPKHGMQLVREDDETKQHVIDVAELVAACTEVEE